MKSKKNSDTKNIKVVKKNMKLIRTIFKINSEETFKNIKKNFKVNVNNKKVF